MTGPADARPRPSAVPPLIVTEDNAFFFDGAKQGKLLIQSCADCHTRRHPPGPVCPVCRSFAWTTIESTRRGTLHSYTVVHRPQDTAFSYPLAIGIVDLEEGTRLVADIEGLAPEDLSIGMPLEVVFAEHAHAEVLPRLRPWREG